MVAGCMRFGRTEGMMVCCERVCMVPYVCVMVWEEASLAEAR